MIQCIYNNNNEVINMLIDLYPEIITNADERIEGYSGNILQYFDDTNV